MKVTFLYVGSSLLAPLKQAERELNREYGLDLTIEAHNFGAPLTNDEWSEIDQELAVSDIVFAIHVMDGENASRLIQALDRHKQQYAAVIVINCMAELMRCTRMGGLDVSRLVREQIGNGKAGKGAAIFSAAASWVGRQVKTNKGTGHKSGHGQYLKFIDRLPGILKFVPSAGALRDVKHYLNIFCYFLQPTPANIHSMVLYALKEYVPDERLKRARLSVPPPERMPSVAIYHPDAPELFESFETYAKWYATSPKSNGKQTANSKQQTAKSKDPSPNAQLLELDPDTTIGLLLMRPQVISKTTKHYDALIRAIEAEGLSVIPALSTLMDNREAVGKFFIEDKSRVQGPKSKVRQQTANSKQQTADSKQETINGRQQTARAEAQSTKAKDQSSEIETLATIQSRVSQIVSLTGFSFVGGPAMNDSEAAASFLQQLNRPYRSAVSLDTQTIDAWRSSQTGLNPIQSGMQIAIPEIDGATEPFVYGGIPASGVEPIPLEERCVRFARRLKRWNRLRTAPRYDLKLAITLFCFPPNKGNIGTAADLDVFRSLWDTLNSLRAEGYNVEVPESADVLREMLIGGNAESFGATANVAYRLTVPEYRRLCPYVEEVETEWGPAPGRVNSFAGELIVQGLQLSNIFVGVQPTFGYEGDPMRLMMARSGAPHHGFMAFYTYLSRVLDVDSVIHLGTHGALEFMPGKQVGLSD